MTKKSKVLPSALISLTFAAAASAAWAGGQTFNVSMQDESRPPRLIKVLDLKAPDIHDVMSADEIAALLPDPEESEVAGAETVQVRGAIPAPYVPGGFAAVYWAVTHPLQSWRVLAPVQ
jgi:hypothetical protein